MATATLNENSLQFIMIDITGGLCLKRRYNFNEKMNEFVCPCVCLYVLVFMLCLLYTHLTTTDYVTFLDQGVDARTSGGRSRSSRSRSRRSSGYVIFVK